VSRGRTGTRKSNNDGQSLVTILFALGIIGWGFFAIDRLTEDGADPKSSRIKGHVAGRTSGWKRDVRDWLNSKLGSDSSPEATLRKQTVHRNLPESELGGIPVLPEPEGLEAESLLGAAEQIPTDGQHDADDKSGEKTAMLFYRLNKKGQPVLTRVKRKLAAANSGLDQMLESLIKGPTPPEIDRDFIDSFIRKPRVRSVAISGRCAVVDFDKNFGAGVSYQTMRFQVQQIFQNLHLWKRISCLEIKINGRHNPHMGSDGLYFPKRIDAVWLSKNV
jgi:spore germination protein GerM